MGNLSPFINNFDASSVDTSSYGPLSPGWYPVLIDAAEVKQTRAGNGAYIHFKLSVSDGPSKGRVIFGNVNISNPNPKAVEIGLRDLAKIAKALNLATIADTSELLNGNLEVKVAVSDQEYNGEKQNEIRDWRALSSASPVASRPVVAPVPSGAATSPAPSAPPAASVPPWLAGKKK